MEISSIFSRAGTWFLQSGIQGREGGVARYYRSDLGCHYPVSTEITGYTASALLYLHAATGEEAYFERALAAARFLVDQTREDGSLPFEPEGGAGGHLAYFFDSGIVVRALLAVWQATSDSDYLNAALALGRAMARDFPDGDGTFRPILKLPGKEPVEIEPLRWSQAPGCYQLKAASAWWQLFQANGDSAFRAAYERALEHSLRTWETFLPGHPDRPGVVDRLHAFLYFLEGLLPRVQETRCAMALSQGIRNVSRWMNETAPEFERCDVYAQLLRIRLYAHGTGAVRLDRAAAEREAGIIAGFQASSPDPRVDGGFYFGRRDGAWLPHVSPVSTAFAVQALLLWENHPQGGPAGQPDWLI